MNMGIRDIVFRTQRHLRTSWIIFTGCFVLIALLILIFEFINLNDQGRAMAALFEKRVAAVDASLDGRICCDGQQTWAVVSHEGRIIASSWKDAAGSSIARSPLFAWLGGVHKGMLSMTIAPVLNSMTPLVIFAANNGGEYRLIAMPHSSLFAIEGSLTQFAVVNERGLCTYSTDEWWVGEFLPRRIMVIDRGRIFLTRHVAFPHVAALELLVYIDITAGCAIGAILALCMTALSLIFWIRSRRIIGDLGLLEAEQSQVVAMIHRFLARPADGGGRAGIDALVGVVGDLAREAAGRRFTFDENRRFNEVMQELCRHILDLATRVGEDARRLSDREHSLRLLLRNLPDLVIRFALDKSIDYANPAAAGFLSVDPSALMGKGLGEAGFPANVVSILSDGLQEVFFRNRLVESEVDIDRPGGRVVLNWRIFPETNDVGAVTSALSIARDVTDIKGAEELVQIANSIILRMRLDGTITFFNQFAERFFGFGREEIIGKNVVGTIVPRTESTGRDLGDLIDAITREPDAYGANMNENVCKNGDRVWIAWTNRGIRGADGRIDEVLCVGNDITVQRRMEEQVNQSLREKEVLLKEIHHRVKNNMQVISSLLSLQTEHMVNDHDRALFIDSQNMVRSMALVHERLYQSKDLAAIDFADYLDGLVNDVLNVYDLTNSRVEISVNADSVMLDIDTAIPCALVVCELISNALKHGFTGRSDGAVTVSFASAGGGNRLVIADNGIGFPDGVDFRNTASLGLQLVIGLVHQLRGTIEMVRGAGTSFIIELPAARGRREGGGHR